MSRPKIEPVRFVPALPWLCAPRAALDAPRLPFPFSEARLRYTFSGTAAVYQGVQALGLQPGDEVLCPAYHCGHEIEPFIRKGCQVSLYRVQSNLEIDLDDIRQRLTPGTKALLVTHYFGFAQPALDELKALCLSNGTFLVEDCAHALFSDNAAHTLGRAGDIAIFSFRKTLPLPHGGGLLINNPALALDAPTQTPSGLSTAVKAIDLYKKALLQYGGSRYSLLKRSGLLIWLPLLKLAEIAWRMDFPSRMQWYDPDDEGLDFDSEILSWGMAPYCQRLLPALMSPDIRARRRHHWQQLATALADHPTIRPAFSSLPAETCPLFFPIQVDAREQWVKNLQAAQIYAAPWWEAHYPKVDWKPFTEATALKARMIALPLHQDLTETALSRMINFLHSH